MFEKDPVDSILIVSSAGPNGTISPLGNTYVAKGSNISFTSTPNIGYVVAYYEVDGFKLDGGTSFGFTNVQLSRTVKVFFKPDPNGINNLDAIGGVSIHPNPAKNLARIDLDLLSETQLTIRLLNTIGQELSTITNSKASAGHHSIEINASALNLSAGVYFISISTQNAVVVKTLVIE